MALNKLSNGYIQGTIAAFKKEPFTSRIKKSDGKGLTIYFLPSGKIEWWYHYAIGGKGNSMPLGDYPLVGLSEARELHRDAYVVWKSGKDPAQVRQDKRAENIEALDSRFEAVARSWFEVWRHGVAPATALVKMGRLEKSIFPSMGRTPVGEINAKRLIAVLKKIEVKGKLVPVRKAWDTCNQVFVYAVSHGLCERNPCSDVKYSAVFKVKETEHHARIGIKQVGKLLRDIDSYGGTEYTRLGLQLMLYIFTRATEMVKTKWVDIDFDDARLTIPRKTTKKKVIPHVIDLPTQAVDILLRLKELSTSSEYIFPSMSGKGHMNAKTTTTALSLMGYLGEMTTHGFRGLAKTTLSEMGYSREITEAQLNHTVSDETEAAYNDAKYRPQRKAMLQAWANYLDVLKEGTGAMVIPLHAKAS